jgi:hypothetical protein
MTDLAELLLTHFRGREDVTAQQNGDGSFHPVQLRGPLSPGAMRAHLGQQTCGGFYLLTPENKAHCSCLDFDNKLERPDAAWRDKAETVYCWLTKLGLCPLSR